MIGLLQKPLIDGYPADFLFARLRGKRRHFLAERSDSWELLQEDYLWTYSAMSRAMRKEFAPCFLLVELRSVQMILRSVAGKNRAQLERISAGSLLHRDLLKAILGCVNIDDLLDLFEDWFGFMLPKDATLRTIYDQGGNRLVEEALVDALLQVLSDRHLKPETEDFIAGQIDNRNLLTAARYLRWQLEDLPLLAGGGEISRQLCEAKERELLEEAVQRLAGSAANDVALLESKLISRTARRLELSARDPLGRGLIVDYLWRRYLAFRRAGLNTWAGAEVGAWEAAL